MATKTTLLLATMCLSVLGSPVLILSSDLELLNPLLEPERHLRIARQVGPIVVQQQQQQQQQQQVGLFPPPPPPPRMPLQPDPFAPHISQSPPFPPQSPPIGGRPIGGMNTHIPGVLPPPQPSSIPCCSHIPMHVSQPHHVGGDEHEGHHGGHEGHHGDYEGYHGGHEGYEGDDEGHEGDHEGHYGHEGYEGHEDHDGDYHGGDHYDDE